MAQVDSSLRFWRSEPFYVRLNAGGMFVFALVFVVAGLIYEFGGRPGSIIFTAIPAVPTAAIALLALRIGGWALKLAAIWAVLLLLLGVAFLAPSLSHVNSFWDFAPALAAIATLVAAFVGSVVSFLQRRRGTVRQTATIAERRTLLGAAAVVGVLALLSGILHVTSVETVSADAKAGAVAVGMKNTEFNPTQLAVPAGQPVTLFVKNDDLGVHTFTVEGLGIDEVIIGGSEQLITIAASSPGSYEFVCEIPGHESMKGTLVVEAAVQ